MNKFASKSNKDVRRPFNGQTNLPGINNSQIAKNSIMGQTSPSFNNIKDNSQELSADDQKNSGGISSPLPIFNNFQIPNWFSPSPLNFGNMFTSNFPFQFLSKNENSSSQSTSNSSLPTNLMMSNSNNLLQSFLLISWLSQLNNNNNTLFQLFPNPFLPNNFPNLFGNYPNPSYYYPRYGHHIWPYNPDFDRNTLPFSSQSKARNENDSSEVKKNENRRNSNDIEVTKRVNDDEDNEDLTPSKGNHLNIYWQIENRFIISAA